MSTETESNEVLKIMQELSEGFDELCRQRHEAGAAEYGQFTFLANDVVRMMAEELADTANYCRMQFVKLMFLQGLIEGDLADKADDDGNITIGVKSFKGTGEMGWTGK